MILKELLEIDEEKRLEFVKANKAAILKAKKGQLKTCDAIYSAPRQTKTTATKADGTGESGVYEIVGNSVGFLDSHQDVSMRGSFDKTVRERGKQEPILIYHDHAPSAIFARNMGVEVKEIAIAQLGYDMVGTTQVVSAKIAPVYDAHMATLYANGEVKQHSIGLKYVKIELAMNDESDNEAFANWNKYLPEVINRSDAEKLGYFFAVKEQQLFEISAVVFGSNQYTPTLSLQNEPQKALVEWKPIDWKAKFLSIN